MFGINKAPKEIEVPHLVRRQNILFWISVGLGFIAFMIYAGGAIFPSLLLGGFAIFLFFKAASMKTTVKASGQTTVYR